jgi:hypothetical protein
VGDWTPTERAIRTKHGTIRYGGPCRDNYRNLVTYDQGGGNTVLELQRPAMLAFLEAQVYYAQACGWSRARIARNTVKVGKLWVPEGRPIILLAGTNRSCETQARLYSSDRNRYASPAITGHTRGLAIDRSNAQPNLDKVDRALAKAGWTRTRPTDEPWHWSAPGVTI